MILHQNATVHRCTPVTPLSAEHLRSLAEGSAIGNEEIAESGARSISHGSELPYEFSDRQRRRAPGILFDTHGPNGKTSHIFRPDGTDPENPGHRYEQPCKSRGAPGNTLDIAPSQHQLIEDTSVPVIFTEGTKKMLSLTSAAKREGVKVLVVGISGCWNWMSEGKPIPDMFDIPVEGRSAIVIPDSDVLRKIEVQDAFKGLAEHLQERGAHVYITYFHDAPDGSKVGADDFFAGNPGGTFAELRLLTRRYDPSSADFVKIRRSRYAKLGGMIEGLWRTYEEMPAAKQAEWSMRTAMRHIIPRAEAGGEVSDDGLLVRIPARPLAHDMRASQPTASKTLRRLEEHCYLQRVPEPAHKIEKHGALYLLYADHTERTESYQHRTEDGTEDNERPLENLENSLEQKTAQNEKPHRNAELYGGDNSACTPLGASRGNPHDVPELRNSKVIHTWARRGGRAVVVDSEYVYRLGKRGWEMLSFVMDQGGSCHDTEAKERFGSPSTTMRNFRRRAISPLLGYRYRKDKETRREVRVELGPEMVTYVGGVISIRDEWREALEEYRRSTGEDADTERQAKRYREQSKAYRTREKRPADEQPSPLMGKERVREITEEDRRKARAARRRKVPEYARESRPNATLWAERKPKMEARHQSKPESEEPETPRKMPPKVGGIYQHGSLCECGWCEGPPVRRYARIRRTG